MTMRLIPNAQAVSEFIAGWNGDCGETAELALLHVINPASYPMNSAQLSTIVRRDIARAWAQANGSEPLSAIVHDLLILGVRFTNFGYAEPYGADWRGTLTQWGGIKPIVFQYARAGHLPGDESGVQYHFNCCLGWDPDTRCGLFADGDNLVERRGGTALVTYSAADLANAGLCGMLVGEYQLGGVQMAIPSGWRDDRDTLTAPNGVPVTLGFREWVLGHAWNPADVPLAPAVGVPQVEIGNPSLGGGTIQWFEFSGQLSWTQSKGVFASWNGDEERALRHALDAAHAQIATLQQELAAAHNAPPPTPQSAPPAVQDTKQTLGS